MDNTGKKLINYGSVVNYYKNKNYKVFSGIDYLSLDLCYTQEEKDLFRYEYNKLSQNSNEFYFTLPSFPWLNFKANLFYQSYFTRLEVTVSCDEFSAISIFQIFVNKDNSKATFTGQYFRYCELKNIPNRELANLLLNHFDNFWWPRELGKLRIIRWDFRIDIFWVTPNTVLSRIKKYNSRKCPNLSRKQSTFIDNWQIETHYIGSRKSKYVFCRIYNKFIDTMKKWKEMLYFNYPDPSTRLEWQTGSQFNGDLTLDDWLIKISSYIGVTDLYKWSYYIARRYDPNVIVNIENYYKNTEKQLDKLVYNKVDIRSMCLSKIDNFNSLQWKFPRLTFYRFENSNENSIFKKS